MGFFDFLNNENRSIEKRDDEYTTTPNNNTSFTSLFNTEEYVGYYDIIAIPTVQACLEIITGTIAQMPIYLYREDSDGSITKVTGDKREFLLNNEASEFTNAFSLKKEMVKNYLVYGGSYVYIEKVGNNVVSLHNLENDRVSIEKFYKNGAFLSDVNFYYSSEGGNLEFKDYDMVKVLQHSYDGVTGRGILRHGKQLFNIVKGENQYVENIYRNGALPMGILQTEGRLTRAVADSLRNAWQNLYGGVRNAGKVVVLEEGLKYQPLTLNPNDLQLADSKKDNRAEICKMFNIPESLVNPQANKYGSLEQNNIYFLQYCLSPILANFESGLNKSLLLETEKEEGLFFAFDTSEILRTTEQEKYNTIKTGLDSGVLSMNEARGKLNLPSIKDDIMKWSLGNVLYNPHTGEMMIPNTGAGIVNGENSGDLPKPQDPNAPMPTSTTKPQPDNSGDNGGKANE